MQVSVSFPWFVKQQVKQASDLSVTAAAAVAAATEDLLICVAAGHKPASCVWAVLTPAAAGLSQRDVVGVWSNNAGSWLRTAC
jgi:hypothetical protein